MRSALRVVSRESRSLTLTTSFVYLYLMTARCLQLLPIHGFDRFIKCQFAPRRAWQPTVPLGHGLTRLVFRALASGRLGEKTHRRRSMTEPPPSVPPCAVRLVQWSAGILPPLSPTVRVYLNLGAHEAFRAPLQKVSQLGSTTCRQSCVRA